jgi:hypothetical protein
MNKSELREILKLAQYKSAGCDLGIIARGLSSLIRASVTKRSRDSLMEYAKPFGVESHPDFVV